MTHRLWVWSSLKSTQILQIDHKEYIVETINSWLKIDQLQAIAVETNYLRLINLEVSSHILVYANLLVLHRKNLLNSFWYITVYYLSFKKAKEKIIDNFIAITLKIWMNNIFCQISNNFGNFRLWKCKFFLKEKSVFFIQNKI